MLDYRLEKELTAEGFAAVCGVDEAGRGPLCGPVFAAACILPIGLELEGLNDSKKLTPKKRDKLFDLIREHAIAYSIASASVEEIDEMNILEADLLAMRRAIDRLQIKADYALIDGNIARDFPLPAKAVIGGDAISPSIAAASILAKVARDRDCIELDRRYPQYGIAKHKGYGTKQHMEALRTYGPSPIHRKQFIRFLNKDEDR
ncbi:MAG: ribonuclease HII [Clostridia bacterium]|nr:ribonuclease HII [Clostridia bacterium]